MRSHQRVWSRGQCDQTHVNVYTRTQFPLCSLCLDSMGTWGSQFSSAGPTSRLLGAAWWQKRKVPTQGRDAQIAMETGMC